MKTETLLIVAGLGVVAFLVLRPHTGPIMGRAPAAPPVSPQRNNPWNDLAIKAADSAIDYLLSPDVNEYTV